MSHHEHEEDDAHLSEDDIVEIHDDDDGDEPMDEDEGEFVNDGEESDGDNAKYDGEIVIGEPQPGEEQEEWERMQAEAAGREDNSWGVTGEASPPSSSEVLICHQLCTALNSPCSPSPSTHCFPTHL